MKEHKGHSITISVLSAILFILAAIIMILSSIKIREVNQCMREENQIDMNHRECENLGRSLAAGSGYLTDEVWYFIATGDIVHINNYWKEIQESKSREKAVEELRSLSVTKEEMNLIEEAKSISDRLIPGETWAMRAAAEVYGLDVSMLPIEVAAVELTPEELNLTSEQLHQLALDYIFGPDYKNQKMKLLKDIDEFQELLYTRRQVELDEAADKTYAALHMTQYLNVSMLLILLVSMISVFLLVTYPFKSYVRMFCEREGKGFAPLEEKGSYNVIQFARAFNRLYEGWKKKEEELEEERFRFRVAIENSSAIVFEYLPDSDIYKAYGIPVKTTEKQSNGAPIERVIPHLMRDRIEGFAGSEGKAALQQLLDEKGGVKELPVSFDGVPIWVRVHAAAAYNEDHQMIKMIGKISNIDSEHEKEVALEEIVHRDSLTGVYNKEAGVGVIQDFMEQRPIDEACCLMILDIDGFKQINAVEGKIFADAILREIAGILRAFTGKDDCIVRLGGDEFMILLKGHTKAKAAALGSQIIAEIENLTPKEHTELTISASIGICMAEAADEYCGVYRGAELALKYSKEHGKGRAVCYSDISDELENGLLQLYASPYTITKIERVSGTQDDLRSFALDLLGKSRNLDDALLLLLSRIGKLYHLDRISIIEVDAEYLSGHVRYQWTKIPSDSQLGKTYYLDRAKLETVMDSYDAEGLCDKDLVGSIDCLGSLLHAAIWNRGCYEGTMSMERREFNCQWTSEERSMLREIVNIIASYTQKAHADAVSQAKTEFLSRMSHEIRTPMNAVIGMTAIAKESLENPEKIRDCLNKIETANNYLMSLVNDILDMSRIESGKLDMHPEDMELTELLEKIEIMIRPQADTKKLDFIIENGYRRKQWLRADKLRLNQILINLLGNAVKFTSQGYVKLNIEEVGDEAGKVMLRFTVSDTGPGISTKAQKRIFNAFEQESAAISSSFGGTGLGLAISSRLVQLMGGELQVKSRPGHGAEFFFTLKLEMAQGGPDMPESEHPNHSLDSRRILLAEDNELNREIAREILIMHGFEVEAVEDGLQAVTMFRDAPPYSYDAVLMDIRMPIMDGLEATRQIRTMEKEDSRTIPIISMTANAFDEDMKQSMMSGMNGHLTKPIDVAKFIEMIRQHTV